jgi:hypothetical protein
LGASREAATQHPASRRGFTTAAGAGILKGASFTPRARSAEGNRAAGRDPRLNSMGLNRFDGVSRVGKDRQSCRPSQNDCKHVNAKTNDSFNRIMAASFPQGLELAVAA